ncbi:kinase-like domain-containing protein [Zopfochytrium polystomum]|nr:kinase-like domain-containing protein [Zopfochytrium polystomum]
MGMTLDQTIAHPLQTPLAGIDSDGDSLGYGSHESAPHSVTNSPLDYTGESAPSSSAPNSSNHRVAREVAEIRFDAMISYAWKDESKVRPIAESLQKMDFRIWLDVRNMGEDTIDSMIEGITQSAAVIAFISDDYVESHNCKKEIKYANEMRKPIIPVRLNDSPAVSISAAAFITAGQLYVDLKNGVTPKSHLEIADRLNRLSLSGLDAITISSDDVVVFDDDDDSFLGDGSVGTVSKGLYLNTTTVAVKTMKLRKLSTSAKDQLINEAKVLSRSRHPFVIGFQGLIKNKGVYSLVLEYATLGSLSEYYRDPAHKNTPLHERVPLLFQIASGMTYLHDTLGIVHNDLKSPNVLLTRLEPRGLVAKITDFGLSKIKDETRSATTNAKVDGSLLWMAPELRRIRPKVTQRNDVFSFAVLMTEVVSWIGVYGRPWGTHMIAVIDALRDEHQRQELLDELQTEVFRSSETTVGAALFGLFRRCWDFDWASRPRFRAVCLELTDLERRSLISRNA